MNLYHYSLIALQFIAFLIHLHNHGNLKPERDLKYNAVFSFYALIILITLVYLSSKK